KPLGMGTMTTAAKLGKITWEELEPAARQMATLNAAAARAMGRVDAHACTDITGFGLIGHAMNIARASELCFTIDAGRVPLFGDVFALAKRGLFSGGAKRGREALGADVDLAGDLDETTIGLLFDAETSGGLLIVVSPDDASALEAALAEEGLPVHAIGRFGPSGEHHIRVRA
ncbi:MAG TPA: selenide, water dikinase SelD, partial [Planctomycetes bacterium]|nr:selenide, water dikinase SelD [Planctomycetota bacterium]